MFVHSFFTEKNSVVILKEKKIIKEFQLTDLCLFTDARYSRHPSMSDLHSPFQDHPMSFEHFPSGTLIPPPPHILHNGVDR